MIMDWLITYTAFFFLLKVFFSSVYTLFDVTQIQYAHFFRFMFLDQNILIYLERVKLRDV
jgi:hypothetical protein